MNLDCWSVPHDLLTAEQREIRDLVRTLARERIAPRAAEIDKSAEFPWDIVELFRENGIFGTLADEEYGGVGASALATLVSIEEISKVCATSGLILAVQELGALAFKLAGQRRAEAALPAAARVRRVARRLRADRAGLGLRRGRDAHRGAPRGRRVRARRLEALHHERGRRRDLRRLREDRPRGRATAGISAFVVEADAPGLEVGRIEPKMGIKGSTTGEVFLDDCRVPAANLIGEEGEGFRLAMRILDRSRPGDRRAGARARPGRDRLRARVRPHARDDGRADREAPAGRRDARRHGDAAARRRAACSTAAARLIDDGRRGRRADEALGDDEALLHRRRDGGHDRRRAGARRLRLHAGVPGRADDARREDHPDLRGHEPDPAARDRPRDAPRAAAPA